MVGLRERERPGGIYPIPTAKAIKANEDRLLLVLSKYSNPRTGQVYRPPELAEIFHYSLKTVQEKLREAGSYRFPPPEVRHDELPENEMAFFMGLGLGDHSVTQVHFGKQDLVVVGTESPNHRKRQLLKQTIGTWGDIHESPRVIRIYVDYPKFDFMFHPTVDEEILRAKKRFAPFLLGALAARLTAQQDRLSLPDEGLLRRIHKTFLHHFGFNIGNFKVGERKDSRKVPVIQVKDPGHVILSLVQVNSVFSLPFRKNIFQPS